MSNVSMPSLNISVKGHYVMCNQVILPRRGVNLLAAARADKGRGYGHPIATTNHVMALASRGAALPEPPPPAIVTFPPNEHEHAR